MKKIFYISVLSLLLLSCSKEKPMAQQQQPLPLTTPTTAPGIYDFKAAIKGLKPVANTLYYEIRVHSNDQYSRQVYTLYPSEINKDGSFSFVFHLDPVWCNGEYTIDTRLTLKGHIQEWRPGNNIWTVPDSAITITRCKPLGQ